MQALTFHAPFDVRFESVEAPRLEESTDALVAVELAGLCGSDLHVYRGHETGLDQGTVLGHEFVGEVLEVGSGVERIAVDDEVIAPFSVCCGGCAACAAGLTSRCAHSELFGWREDGRGLHGAQAERVRVPFADDTLFSRPEGLSADVSLLLGDVLATGLFGFHGAEVGAGAVLGVVGAGPVGLCAVLAAAAGVRPQESVAEIFVVDPVEERRALAVSWGAAAAMDPSEAETSWRSRCDGVVEAVGHGSALRTAFQIVKPGGTIASVGVHNEPQLPFSPADAYDKNLTWRTGRCPARALVGETTALAVEHGDRLQSLISHRLPLSDGARAYDLFDRKRDGCTKVVFEIDR